VAPTASELAGRDRRSVRRLSRQRLVSIFLAALTSIAGAVVTSVVAAGPAAAHNGLVSTTPTDGATVARAPSAVALTFDEPALALGTALVVTDSAGQQVQAGSASLIDTTVSQALQPGIPAGEYAVTWRVTSADGHPISGRFTFTAKAPATGDRQGASSTPNPAGSAADQDQQPSSGGIPTWGLLLAGVAVVAALFVLAKRGRRRAAS
jgi:methionine-rich copper-binding protein CopC